MSDVSSGGVKLTKSEAAKLAAFLLRVGRPASPDDQAEMMRWHRRLEGARS